MNRIRLVIILLFFSLPGWGQEGNLYIKNYIIPFDNIEHQYFGAIQDREGNMLFANIHGIVKYNGISWEMIRTFETPYAIIENPLNGDVLIGSNKSFGFFSKNKYNNLIYKSLSEYIKPDSKIKNIFFTDKRFYFCSDKALYAFNQDYEPLGVISDTNGFNGFFRYKNHLFVNIKNKGIHLLNDTMLVPSVSDSVFLENGILGSAMIGDSVVIITSTNGNSYAFDSVSYRLIQYQTDEYIKGNVLTGILGFNDKVVLSTLSGGCLILNPREPAYKRIINYQGGLPDDEVMTMCGDHAGGLWICHEYGISRVDTRLPVQNFSLYQGISGNIFSSLFFNNTLYVSTSEGVYYLSNVEKVEDVENFIRKEHRQTTSIQRYTTIRKVKKMISIEFYKKGTSESQEDSLPIIQKIPVILEIPVDSVATTTVDEFSDKQVRKVYALQSIPYIFKKVKGLEGKCRQLLVTGNQLFVAAYNGIYRVNNGKAYPVTTNHYINCMIHYDEGMEKYILAGQENGAYLYKISGETLILSDGSSNKGPVHSLAHKNNEIWAGSENYALRFFIQEGKFIQQEKFIVHEKYKENVRVMQVKDKIAIFSYTGIYSMDSVTGSIGMDADLSARYQDIQSLISNQQDYFWLQMNNQWIEVYENKILSPRYLKLFKDVTDISVDTSGNFWVVSENQLFKIAETNKDSLEIIFDIAINKMLDKQHNPLPLQSFNLNYSNNSVTVDLSAFYYIGEENTQFRYILEGMHDNWSEWSPKNTIEFPYLPYGRYTLTVQSRNIFGQLSTEKSIRFRVAPPIWLRWWFFLLSAFLLFLLIYLFLKVRTKQLELANKALQDKINKATAEIRIQKEELEVAYDDIELKNKNITGSIHYAQRIQTAILPMDINVRKALPNSFVFFRPRDIVSGDFYWFYEEDDRIVIVAADCTGHGVPGAFMSMIGNTLLNEVVKERKIFMPGEILENLDQEIIKSLKQDVQGSDSSDGMDIAICMIDRNKKKLYYGGAKNSLIVIENESLKEIEADRFSIGGKMFVDIEKKFATHELDYSKDSCYYIFSDGFTDQNGGTKGKKYMYGRFQQLLLAIHKESFDDQPHILNFELDEWRGEHPQRDDVIVIGFKPE